MNPVLNNKYYIADPEARLMPDGKIHIYGSTDLSGDSEFCSTQYLGFSSCDLVNWDYDGVIFSSQGSHADVDYGYNKPLTLGGPDCVHKNGKYFLYYCTYGNGERVAVSENPSGPFYDLGAIEEADGDSIDPAVLVDDDGGVYYFWGQHSLKGARLKEDMRTLDRSTIHCSIITEHEHGFHEGASIRKINGRYYMVYTDISRGKATCLSYAISDNPFGPYVKQGVIIDNMGCDPDTWNNHGSIEKIAGRWYVFYHRSSQNSIYNRRLCIEPIEIDENGVIHEVSMTSSGVNSSISAFSVIDASMACRIKQDLPFSKSIPIRIEPRGNGAEVIAFSKNDDWVQYKHIDFGNDNRPMSVIISASGRKPSFIEIYIENGEMIGKCLVNDTGGWDKYKEFSADVKVVKGIHAIWLVFRSAELSVGRLADINWFKFRR